MSFYILWGSLEIGLVFSLVALGVFITFRVLNFPDLTVDGSFPLGGAVAATLIFPGGTIPSWPRPSPRRQARWPVC